MFGLLFGIARAMFYGVVDSVNIKSFVLFMNASRTIRSRATYCLILNIVIFVGSILVMEHIISPLLRWLVMPTGTGAGAGTGTGTGTSSDGGHHVMVTLGSFLDHALFALYHVAWVYPVYGISFLFNSVWYSDIAEHAFQLYDTYAFNGKRKSTRALTLTSFISGMAEELYRTLLGLSYLIETSILSFIPVVGPALSVLHLCWLYSLFSFEYKWSFEGWKLEARLSYIETHWAYFAGFGFIPAVVTVVFPKFINSGVFAFIFPLFLIVAIVAKPVSHAPKRSPPDPASSGGGGGSTLMPDGVVLKDGKWWKQVPDPASPQPFKWIQIPPPPQQPPTAQPSTAAAAAAKYPLPLFQFSKSLNTLILRLLAIAGPSAGSGASDGDAAAAAAAAAASDKPPARSCARRCVRVVVVLSLIVATAGTLFGAWFRCANAANDDSHPQSVSDCIQLTIFGRKFM